MNEDMKRVLLAELIEMSAPPAPVAADEVTVREYANQANCSLNSAQRRLDQLVAAGVLTFRTATNANGHPCRAYRRAE